MKLVYSLTILALLSVGLFSASAQSTLINRTSPASASAQQFFFDNTHNNVTDRNWKIATLPASSTSTGDKLTIELFGGSHGSNSTFQQTIHLANRNAFNGYLRTTFGEPYQSVRIRAYQQANGSVDVFMSLLATGWKGASVRIYEGSAISAVGPTIYETPIDVGASPSGTLVFDSYTKVPGLVVRNSGKTGIGVSNPDMKLSVYSSDQYIARFHHSGSLTISGFRSGRFGSYVDMINTTGGFGIGAGSSSTGLPLSTQSVNDVDFFIKNSDGFVGIGTTTPDMNLTVQGNVNVGGTGNGMVKARHVNGKSHTSAGYGDLYLQYHTSHPVRIGTNTNPASLFVKGNVGIGTNTADEKLTVKGKIHAEEVRVDLSVPGPDYVFADNYELTTLEELEKFIQSNKHLPEVPTAKEMEANGVELGEMNMLLLKKIEELTLHIIRMDKELQELKSGE
ncbi:MAG: tail fiber protein [Cyclobacteriaceae bacterium]